MKVSFFVVLILLPLHNLLREKEKREENKNGVTTKENKQKKSEY